MKRVSSEGVELEKKIDEERETGKQKWGGNERGARGRTAIDSTFSFIDCT